MWVMAGPAASRVLADHGADVIRVESTHRIDTARTLAPFVGNEGDPEKSGLFNNLNGNKRGLALDLVQSAEPRGHAGPRALGRRRRRRVLAPRHGIPRAGPRDAARALKPELDRGVDLPQRTDRPAVVAGRLRDDGGGDVGLLLHLRLARSGALRARSAPTPTTSHPATSCARCWPPSEHRRRTGQGQYIDFSQSEGSIHNLSSILLDHVVNGRIAERMGNDDDRFAPHGVYPSLGDDQWIAVVCETDEQWRALGEVLGGRAAGTGGPDDRRAARAPAGARRARRRLDRDPAGGRRQRRRSRRWACPPTRSPTRPRRSPTRSSAHRRHFVEVPHGKLGTTWMEGSRFTLSRTPAVMWRAGPRLRRGHLRDPRRRRSATTPTASPTWRRRHPRIARPDHTGSTTEARPGGLDRAGRRAPPC